MNFYAKDPIGETSAGSSLFSLVWRLNENLVAVEKCSLRVELPGKTIRIYPINLHIKLSSERN
jgi:hypothetical protein